MPSTLLKLSLSSLNEFQKDEVSSFFCGKIRMVFESIFSAKASIRQVVLYAKMLDSKGNMFIGLRAIPVICVMFKNTKFAVFMQIVFYIWKNIREVFSQTNVVDNLKKTNIYEN
jgi:hypothetical protein